MVLFKEMRFRSAYLENTIVSTCTGVPWISESLITTDILIMDASMKTCLHFLSYLE